jgi:hypothetical protein
MQRARTLASFEPVLYDIVLTREPASTPSQSLPG